MHKGTTPSRATRRLIARAMGEGVALEKQVEAFVVLAREARRRFSDEVTPLHLADEPYRLVAEASGMTGLFELAYRMEEALSSVTAA